MSEKRDLSIMKHIPINSFGKKTGFTLVEALIALAMMGVLATLTIPMISGDINNTTLFNRSKAAASEIGNAYAKYVNSSVPYAGTSITEIVHNINYVRKIAVTSTPPEQTTQLMTVGGAKVTRACDETYPCLLLQNGGVIQYTQEAIFGTYGATGVADRNLSGMLFIYDPDGKGINPGIPLVLSFGGRVTVYSQAGYPGYPPTLIYGDASPPYDLTTVEDPPYILKWLEG